MLWALEAAAEARGGMLGADVSLPRPWARAQRSSCFAAMGNAGWTGRPVVADDRARAVES